jgi:PAS domain S-box-containing protein
VANRPDLLLRFTQQAASHSALAGDALESLLVAAISCLRDGTSSQAVTFVDAPTVGEDLLLRHEIDLAAALDAAGLAPAAGLDEPLASLPSPVLETPERGWVVDATGVAWLPLRGTEHLLGAVRLEAPRRGWTGDEVPAFATSVVEVLATTVHRHWHEVQHQGRAEALEEAQRGTHVGSFEWDIVTNKVRWSDELFRIYGCEPQSFEPTFEEFLERIVPEDREAIRASVFQAYEERRDYRIEERILRPDGTMRLLASWGHVITNERSEPVKIIGSCHDVTDIRRTMDELAATERRLAEVHERQTEALEINDNVVQGLAAAAYALQLGLPDAAAEAISGTLAAARAMVGDRLADTDDALLPAALRRERAAPAYLGADHRPTPRVGTREDPIRIVIADDSDDIRMLVTFILSVEDDFSVVGEAADGLEAIVQAGKHRPDVLLLDLAMPVLDGLEAIPRVRDVSPETLIVMLSGFDARTAAAGVVERGAVAFVEKGVLGQSLANVIREICDRAVGDPPLIVGSRS